MYVPLSGNNDHKFLKRRKAEYAKIVYDGEIIAIKKPPP
jgi:hypothetical protein